MLTDDEKAELRQIVNKFVEQRRCFRPIHPDEVMKEVNWSRRTESGLDEVESSEAGPRFQV